MTTQKNKWERELERLSKKRYKQTDSQLFNVYKDALKDIKTHLNMYLKAYETLTFAKKLEVERLFNVATEIDHILETAYAKVDDIIAGHVYDSAKQGYEGVWYGLEQSQKVKLSMPLIDHDYITNLVKSPVAGKTLSKRLYKYRKQLAKQVTNEIVQGMLNGEGYSSIARNIANTTEASYKQALRITITEAGRVESVTTQKGYEESEKLGVDLEKKWLATFDRKTRHTHQELDGQTVPIDGKFNSNGHKAEGPRLFGIAAEDINCRCTTIAVVNGVSPELRKDNVFGDFVPFTNYKEWSTNLWGARSAE